MLIDSRDAFFQSNPFADVERNTDGSQADGLLYLFEVSDIQRPRLGVFYLSTHASFT